MSLRIVPASQPIEIKNIVLTEYSVPGLGKSSLAYTAEAPLMLAFDGGCYRAAVRRGDTVLINAWEDVEGISADDLKPYKTVIIDTGGRAGDLLKASLIKQDPKNAKIPQSASATCMVVYRALATMDRSWVDAWLDYLPRLDKAAQGLFAMQVRNPSYKKQSVIMTNTKFTKWAMDNNYMFTSDKE